MQNRWRQRAPLLDGPTMSHKSVACSAFLASANTSMCAPRSPTTLHNKPRLMFALRLLVSWCTAPTIFRHHATKQDECATMQALRAACAQNDVWQVQCATRPQQPSAVQRSVALRTVIRHHAFRSLTPHAGSPVEAYYRFNAGARRGMLPMPPAYRRMAQRTSCCT